MKYDVIVTGTRFQVRVADADAAVTLFEGEVHVAARLANGPERVASLRRGQMLRSKRTAPSAARRPPT